MLEMLDCNCAFGKAIRAVRKEQGVSQEELAFLAGIDRSNVSLIELGKTSPTLDTVFRLCSALDCRFMDIARLTQVFLDDPLANDSSRPSS